MLVFLKGKPCKELGLGSPGQPLVTSLQGHMCLCMCVSVSKQNVFVCVCFYGAFSAAAEGLWTSRVPMSGAGIQEGWDPGDRHCLRPAAGQTHMVQIFICIHTYISYSWTFLLISQTGEETAEAVYACVRTDQPVCADLRVQLSVYVFCMCVSLCVPTENSCRAGESGPVTFLPLSGHWISNIKTLRQ